MGWRVELKGLANIVGALAYAPVAYAHDEDFVLNTCGWLCWKGIGWLEHAFPVLGPEGFPFENFVYNVVVIGHLYTQLIMLRDLRCVVYVNR